MRNRTFWIASEAVGLFCGTGFCLKTTLKQYNTMQYNAIQILLSTPHGGRFSETMIKIIKKKYSKIFYKFPLIRIRFRQYYACVLPPV